MKKIFISTPCYDGSVTKDYMLSMLKLVEELKKENIEYKLDMISGESLIPRARNNSLHKFYKTNCTHLLFIDADIEFKASALINNLKKDNDVTCCCYPKKNISIQRMLYSIKNDKESKEEPISRGLDYAYNAEYDDDFNIIEKDNCIKVRHGATGFMLIKREILTKMKEKYKEELKIRVEEEKYMCGLFCCMIKDDVYLSEDYAFCERVYETGGEVWMNMTENLNHTGRFKYKSDIVNRSYKGRKASDKLFFN